MATLALATLVIVAVLLGPVLIKPIEREVEFFFLVIGLITAALMGQFNMALVRGALLDPLPFTAAVLFFGAAFRLFADHLDRLLGRIVRVTDPRILCFCLSLVLASLAPLVTPVVSALVFVEAISLLGYDRSVEVAATVLACFAIGIGAGLTPLGMPAIAVVLRSLNADFWYLINLLGWFVVVGVAIASVPILFLPFASGEPMQTVRPKDSWMTVLAARPGRVYVFIAGLVALSDGLRPVVNAYVHRIPESLLFWMNTLSAVLDNSTLAAVEISPSLNMSQQRAALLSLLISGGMLITGNIPNVVAASRLRITSREWARIGVVVGVVLLILCFAALIAAAS